MEEVEWERGWRGGGRKWGSERKTLEECYWGRGMRSEGKMGRRKREMGRD